MIGIIHNTNLDREFHHLHLLFLYPETSAEAGEREEKKLRREGGV